MRLTQLLRDTLHALIATCARDILCYAEAARLESQFGTSTIHPNHFMHGSMVSTELDKRMREAAAHAAHGGAAG